MRDTTIDGLKFLLICLVTIGHAIEPTRYADECSGVLYAAIYSFHMPLFVLLSGYFSKNQELGKINRQALSLLETFLVMTISIGLLLGRQPLYLVLKPSPSCWYLLSLVAWRYMLYWLVSVKGFSNCGIMGCSLVIAATFLLLPVPSKPLAILTVMRTTQYFPFFVLGYCLTSVHVTKIRETGMIRATMWMVAFALLTLCCIYSGKGLHTLEYHRDTLYGLSSQFGWSLGEGAVYLVGVTAVAVVVSLALLSVKQLPRLFCDYGRHSLVFYFVQGLLTFKLADVLPANLLIELLLGLGIIVVGGGNFKVVPVGCHPCLCYCKGGKEMGAGVS